MGAREVLNDNDLFSTMDAHAWANRFVERVAENPDIATDVGTMLAWFAGAIMTGYDNGIKVGRAMEAAEQQVWIRPLGPPKEWPQQASQHCPTCNLKLEGVMGYVCGNVECPVGLGGVRC